MQLSGESLMKCENNIDRTLVDGLGLTKHPKQSILSPSQHNDFVRFTLNSVDTIVKLTVQKHENIIMECKKILSNKSITMRDIANLVSPGIYMRFFTINPLRFREI